MNNHSSRSVIPVFIRDILSVVSQDLSSKTVDDEKESGCLVKVFLDIVQTMCIVSDMKTTHDDDYITLEIQDNTAQMEIKLWKEESLINTIKQYVFLI